MTFGRWFGRLGASLCTMGCVVIVSAPQAARAMDPPAREPSTRSLAPYFEVAPKAGGIERLPLRETSAFIEVTGVIAQIFVRQVFENTGKEPIEAVYVFPASTRAAVHGMRMRIGERTVEARIDKRQLAREQYDQAKADGQRASLLEQERPNVFTMRVANIMPGDRIEVQLDYSELLVPEGGVYELVYPTVVAPRYEGGADAKRDVWIANPYLPEGRPAPHAMALNVHLETGIPIRELTSPSHSIDVSYGSPASADVTLASPDETTGDFVLRYRLAGDRIESGLLLFEDADEKFFLLMLEPPARPKPKDVPAREFIFILDVSGSMNGYPLEVARRLADGLLSELRPIDTFNLVLFESSAAVWQPNGSVPASRENVRNAFQFMAQRAGGGGTEILSAMRRAYELPTRDDRQSRTMVVVTDGLVPVEKEAFRFVREHLSEANLFAFGVGTSVNRALIEGLARAGAGAPYIVLNPSEAAAQTARFIEYVRQPLLTHINIELAGFATDQVAPQKLPDLLAERPLILFGKYLDPPAGEIVVSGYTGTGRLERRIDVSAATARPENAPLRVLWARKWVELLEDDQAMSPSASLEETITALGLTYGILTPFTSFIAVDSERANSTGRVEAVKQPLPLPDGVSNLAVGGGFAQAGPHFSAFGGVGRATGMLLGGGGGGSLSGTLNNVIGSSGANSPQLATGAVAGALPREVIRKVIDDHKAQIRACYERRLQANPKLEGKLSVKWVIGATGAVVRVVITESALKDREVEACVVEVVKQWVFPPPAGGGIVEVNYPFIFRAP